MRLSFVRISLLFRVCRRFVRRQEFDLVLGLINEADLGQRGIQYVHFPAEYEPRPSYDLRWFHRLPLILKSYRFCCRRLCGHSTRRLRQNLTLVNSDYVKQKVREAHGIASIIVYPPVSGDCPDVPWSDRHDGFMLIGRLDREKRVEKVIAILAFVRERGHDIKLHIVGTAPGTRYSRMVLRLAKQHENWVKLHLGIARHRLTELLAQNRYGIHGMIGEHFGIAVAEMLRAGCIPFVHAEGGPSEIVGRESRLMYESHDQAVQKIDDVLRHTDLQHELRQHLHQRRDLFTTDRFMAEMRQIVDEFAEQQCGVSEK